MLDPEQRLAGVAAAGILLSLFTPWWRDPVFGLSAWGINRITWVELSLVLGAGSVLLVIVRARDPPTRTLAGHALDYDLRWGILLCLMSGGLLAFAGLRARRRHHRGQPESVAADADAQPTLPITH